MESEQQKKLSQLRYQYQVPSKLQVEDKIVSLGPFALTLRQTLILIVGGCIAMNIWRSLVGVTTLPVILRVALAILPVVIAFLWGMVKVGGRYTEVWFLILWRYYGLAKIYYWRASSIHQFDVSTQNVSRLRKRHVASSALDEESE